MSEGGEISEISLPQVTFDQKLNSYKIDQPSTQFTMWLTQEAWDKKKQHKWVDVRADFEKEIERITKDPFGEANIDPSKAKAKAQQLRTLNRVTGGLQALSPDMPLLLKGTGKTTRDDPERENLIEQFQVMRRLKMREREYMPPEMQEFIHIADVQGVISYPIQGEQGIQEWLLMEYVPDSQIVKDYTLPNDGNPDHLYNGFDRTEHPALDIFTKQHCPPEDYLENGNLVRFKSLRSALRHYGINLRRMNGRDILWREIDKGKAYTIIDMKNDDISVPFTIK